MKKTSKNNLVVTAILIGGAIALYLYIQPPHTPPVFKKS